MKVGLTIMPMWAPSVPPLGISYIRECLKIDGHDVQIFDYNVILHKRYLADTGATGGNDIWGGGYAFDWEVTSRYEEKIHPQLLPYLTTALEEIENWVRSEKIEALGMSLFGTNSNVTRFMCFKLKGMIPELKIFIGGAHTFNNPWKKEVERGIIDACVVGEGEQSSRDLIAAWSKGDMHSPIQGIFRKTSEGNLTPFTRRELIDLSTLPIATHELFDFKLYDWGQIPIQMSRGCVALCTFCDEVKFWERFRYRRPEDIFEEMKSNSERLGINLFLVMDSLLNGHHKNFVKLAKLINESGLKLFYGGNARIDKRLTREVLEDLKNSGCAHLTFGLESGSQRILDSMKKGIKIEWAIDNLRNCTELGIAVNLNLIVGYPGEEEEDFLQTMSFLEDHRNNYTSVSTGMGMGLGMDTDVFDDARKFGIRVNEDGTPWFGPNGWETADGRNTQAVRDERLQRVRRMLKSHNKKYSPEDS
jgi:anaerobic magnesium-protoporphyrin IX monomethyl ester cyclase